MINMVRNPEDNSNSPYSAGTALAIDGLELLLKVDPSDMPNTFCVNIGTLVRNSLSYFGELRPTVLEQQIQNEIAAIVIDVKSLMQFAGIKDPLIYFYWHGWKKAIPQELQRAESKVRANINNNLDILLNRRYNLLDRVGDDVPTISVSLTQHREGRLPHKEILKDLMRLPGRRKILMLSHYALDYHVINKGSIAFKLLESYTGNVGGKERLNFKLFGNERIPFCGIIHQLLGDPDQLKPPIKRSEIKLIKETAITEKWSQYPISDISKKIKNLGFGRYVEID